MSGNCWFVWARKKNRMKRAKRIVILVQRWETQETFLSDTTDFSFSHSTLINKVLSFPSCCNTFHKKNPKYNPSNGPPQGANVKIEKCGLLLSQSFERKQVFGEKFCNVKTFVNVSIRILSNSFSKLINYFPFFFGFHLSVLLSANSKRQHTVLKIWGLSWTF